MWLARRAEATSHQLALIHCNKEQGASHWERAESRRELGCYTMQTFMWLGENCVGVMGYDLLNMWRVTGARAATAEECSVLVRIVTAKTMSREEF